jgi:hypothetical protein
MKGFSFQSGIEYRVEIKGEEWSQGDSLSGIVTAKPGSPIRVMLAEGTDKKIKKKVADAFRIVESKESEGTELHWNFHLPLNATITDKNQSLYLLYGNKEGALPAGALRLSILPHLYLRDFADVLIHHFRFALKSVSAGKKGVVEFKLNPPDSKEFASLESLLLNFKMDSNGIVVDYEFTRNAIDATGGSIASKSVKKTWTKELLFKEILHDFNQRLNKDLIMALSESVIHEYQGSSWI